MFLVKHRRERFSSSGRNADLLSPWPLHLYLLLVYRYKWVKFAKNRSKIVVKATNATAHQKLGFQEALNHHPRGDEAVKR